MLNCRVRILEESLDPSVGKRLVSRPNAHQSLTGCISGSAGTFLKQSYIWLQPEVRICMFGIYCFGTQLAECFLPPGAHLLYYCNVLWNDTCNRRSIKCGVRQNYTRGCFDVCSFSGCSMYLRHCHKLDDLMYSKQYFSADNKKFSSLNFCSAVPQHYRDCADQ